MLWERNIDACMCGYGVAMSMSVCHASQPPSSTAYKKGTGSAVLKRQVQAGRSLLGRGEGSWEVRGSEEEVREVKQCYTLKIGDREDMLG